MIDDICNIIYKYNHFFLFRNVINDYRSCIILKTKNVYHNRERLIIYNGHYGLFRIFLLICE